MPSSLGPAEILVILLVALIVLGPTKLPGAARQVGKTIAEVRKWSQGLQDEIRTVIDTDMAPSYPTEMLRQPEPPAEPATPDPTALAPPAAAAAPMWPGQSEPPPPPSPPSVLAPPLPAPPMRIPMLPMQTVPAAANGKAATNGHVTGPVHTEPPQPPPEQPGQPGPPAAEPPRP